MLIKTKSLERKIKSLISLKFKKTIVRFFVNSFTGLIIKKINKKINLYNGIFDYSLVSNHEAASIFLVSGNLQRLDLQKDSQNQKL